MGLHFSLLWYTAITGCPLTSCLPLLREWPCSLLKQYCLHYVLAYSNDVGDRDQLFSYKKRMYSHSEECVLLISYQSQYEVIITYLILSGWSHALNVDWHEHGTYKAIFLEVAEDIGNSCWPCSVWVWVLQCQLSLAAVSSSYSSLRPHYSYDYHFFISQFSFSKRQYPLCHLKRNTVENFALTLHTKT